MLAVDIPVRPGETIASYQKRVDKETREKLTNSWKDTKKISQRKKDYYERLKLKRRAREAKRKAHSSSAHSDSDSSEGEGFPSKSKYRDFSDLQDKVDFGEVAHEPPAIVPIFKKRAASSLPSPPPRKKAKVE